MLRPRSRRVAPRLDSSTAGLLPTPTPSLPTKSRSVPRYLMRSSAKESRALHDARRCSNSSTAEFTTENTCKQYCGGKWPLSLIHARTSRSSPRSTSYAIARSRFYWVGNQKWLAKCWRTSLVPIGDQPPTTSASWARPCGSLGTSRGSQTTILQIQLGWHFLGSSCFKKLANMSTGTWTLINKDFLAFFSGLHGRQSPWRPFQQLDDGRETT